MPAPRTAKLAPPRKPAAPPPRRFVLRTLLHLTIGAGLVAGVAYATDASRRFVEQTDAADAGPIKVELVDRPAWMSDYLARQIAASVPRGPASPFDHQLLVTAAARLAANPWVQQVHQVRRAYGDAPGDRIIVDCAYRVPAALVRWGRHYWLIDNDGVKLPDPFAESDLPQVTVGHDGRTALRTIAGLRQPPPPDGRKWPGADLAAALDMAKLAYDKPYLDGISGIDVSNFGGRISRSKPQLVLTTKYGTEVWWGRPPLADDFYVEQPVARKLATLAAVVRKFGRVDAGKPKLDVRFDTALVPTDDPTATDH